MKKLIFMGVLGLFILGSCNNKAGHNHEGHNHGTEAHDHEHEGHDHEQEIHNTKEECQDHDHGEEASSGHSDEIILPKAKADAAGVKVSVIEPGTFEQVIKTSGCDQLSWESNRRNEHEQRCYIAHYLFQQYS